MVQISKAHRKIVYTYLLREGVIVIQKDWSVEEHPGTEVQNLQVWMLLRSLKDRGFVELIFNWQYFYFFLNENGKKYLAEYLGLTEEVVPLTWKKDDKRQYEFNDNRGRVRKVRHDRDNNPNAPRGGRGGRRPPRADGTTPAAETKPEEATTTQQ